MISLYFFTCLWFSVSGLHLNQGAYEDLVVSISDIVPNDDCQVILTNLKAALTTSSQYLFNALDSRAYFRSIQIILPESWPETCAQNPIVANNDENFDNIATPETKIENQPQDINIQMQADRNTGIKFKNHANSIKTSSGEKSDISIVPYGPTGAKIWTQQSAGCGKSGDQIYLTYDILKTKDQNLGRLLVKEFAKYRYGVFDEHGFNHDQVYPICYKDNENEPMKVTSCSDMPVHDNGLCTNTRMPFNVSDLVETTARSSIMFAAEAPSVKIFCDEGIHDRNSPTKHNFMCNRRSTLDVILQHSDFFGKTVKESKGIIDTTPIFELNKAILTRYVMIIEDTKEMMLRESWTYLRNAIRKWAVYDLPSNTEVGLVMANETKAFKVTDVTSLKNPKNRDLVASNIPYTPGDARAPACLQCAMKDAIHMLEERRKTHGPANSVIILIAPGMEHSQQMPELAKEAKNSKIKIATINYPGVFRQQMLDSVALETNGVAFTVQEKRHNVDTSLLTTYFQLTNVMYSIMQEFYQGNPLDLPVEIHRRELYDDGRNSVTGSFVLDADLGEPARFALFTHNVDSPLIKSLILWSPSQQLYQAKSESLLSVKIITIAANLNETGTWTYKIERFSGNPQPHFIQVTATPRYKEASIVRTKFWTGYNQPGGPIVLYVEVKKQERPVMGAKVEVTVSRPEHNGTGTYKEKFDLLDTGSGDPDVTKGDGIYTRYFSAAAAGGAGMYTFDVTVTDNGNTAYAVPDQLGETIDSNNPCCGSFVQKSKVQPLSSFQRVLTPITKFITPEEIMSSYQLSIGRIGDLRAQVFKDEQKVKLLWTAPDMGGVNVARYEIKFASYIHDITEKYETKAVIWENGTPFPQSPGSETSFSMNFTQEMALKDKPLYFAIKAFSQTQDGLSGPISNWVRIFVPSPLPPSTQSPTFQETVVSWPSLNHKSNDVNINVKPRTANNLDLGLQLILPIVVGVISLAVITAVYCYCTVIRRRKRTETKKTNELSTVTVVPPSTNSIQSSNNSPEHNNAYTIDVNDPHTVPIYEDQKYEDEPLKKRLSIVHQQEQQLIEELKQQHHLQRDLVQIPTTYEGIRAIIPNNKGGRTLNPYDCWTASQLLREHEKRANPAIIDDVIDEMTPHHQQDHLMREPSLDHMSLNGNRIQEHFVTSPPPVPPLPSYNGYPVNYNNIYEVHQPQLVHPNVHNVPPNLYQSLHRNDNMVPFNSSLQGSMSSVNSGEKKRRNVTMV